MKRVINAITDTVGGYTRLTCPICGHEIRHRGVISPAAESPEEQMAGHIKNRH